ncbi:phage tail protein I [Iodobacter sp. BJB302]|uniref:phage tail protein I n=1 Tax=Iodobacter sp. BJB302 TaxID=1506510 RepID=UPI000C0F3CCA|nr:phage tail protein I [Iodobacter sp. BJB302]PHV01656.1 phage tail protein I [Iodobacter sp. BJB302]
MTKSLLPTGSSKLERAIAESCQAGQELPILLAALWNADTCPKAALPYLAWAFSVDRWDEHWSEPVQREVIRQSFFVHQHKGTIGALKRIVEPLGYRLEITEWWEENPTGPRGTFRLEVKTIDQGITEETQIELNYLIDEAKPLSRHLIEMNISVEPRGLIYTGVGQYQGEVINIYPKAIDTL